MAPAYCDAGLRQEATNTTNKKGLYYKYYHAILEKQWKKNRRKSEETLIFSHLTTFLAKSPSMLETTGNPLATRERSSGNSG